MICKCGSTMTMLGVNVPLDEEVYECMYCGEVVDLPIYPDIYCRQIDFSTEPTPLLLEISERKHSVTLVNKPTKNVGL